MKRRNGDFRITFITSFFIRREDSRTRLNVKRLATSYSHCDDPITEHHKFNFH